MSASIHEQLDDQALVQSLGSKTCPSCGGPKQRAQTFCKREYFKLPMPMRKALYARLGHGYREAVAEAMQYLEATTFQMPPE